MKIKKEEIGGVTIFRISGKILIGEGDEMIREAVRDFVDKGGEKLILDMAEVPYGDSAGMGELIRSYTTLSRATEGRGKLKLINIQERIRNFLTITKLLEIFDVYEDEEEAIRSFK